MIYTDEFAKWKSPSLLLAVLRKNEKRQVRQIDL